MNSPETTTDTVKKPRIGGDKPRGFEIDPSARSRGGKVIRLSTALDLRKFVANTMRSVRLAGVEKGPDGAPLPEAPPLTLAKARIISPLAAVMAKLIELTDHEERIRSIERLQATAARATGGH